MQNINMKRILTLASVFAAVVLSSQDTIKLTECPSLLRECVKGVDKAVAVTGVTVKSDKDAARCPSTARMPRLVKQSVRKFTSFGL